MDFDVVIDKDRKVLFDGHYLKVIRWIEENKHFLPDSTLVCVGHTTITVRARDYLSMYD
jgi:hypothetical protein